MSSTESLRKHLRVLECLAESEKSAVFERLSDMSENVRESELRALLLREEAFLVGKKRVRLVSGIPRIPHDATRVADIREAGKYLTELLCVLREAATEGVSLSEIDLLTRAFARKYGLELPMLGYGGFAHSVTVGVNDRVVHAVPDESVFRRGDLVTIDTAVRYRTGIADSAVAFVVGGEEANPRAHEIVRTLKSALDGALPSIRAGAALSEFSFRLYDRVVSSGYRVVKNCNGHGVGAELHEPPYVYHWPNSHTDKTVLSMGDIITVEPIVTEFSNFVEYPGGDVGFLPQGDIGAYWEYTLRVGENGPEILSGIR